MSATASTYFFEANRSFRTVGAMSSTSCGTVRARPQTVTSVVDAPAASVVDATAKAHGVFETLTSAASATAAPRFAKPAGSRSVVSSPKMTSGSTTTGSSASAASST